jgi:hypothetical protein
MKLMRVEASKPGRRFGALQGKVSVPDEFFEPLPRDELRAWEK